MGTTRLVKPTSFKKHMLFIEDPPIPEMLTALSGCAYDISLMSSPAMLQFDPPSIMAGLWRHLSSLSIVASVGMITAMLVCLLGFLLDRNLSSSLCVTLLVPS